MADTDFLDATHDPVAMDAFSKAEPGSAQLVVQHHHGFITAQKVDQPRDDSKVLAKMKVLASMAGDFYYYEWPTKNRDGTTGTVSGGTIKLANDLARTYGNCVNTIDCRMVDQYLLFKARFTDLESGYSLERMFQQRMAQNIGSKMDAERARDIVFQIGQSKAIRNVTLNALQTFADFSVEEARQSLIEKFGKDVKRYQELAAKALEDLGIDIVNVERVLARKVDDWRARDIARVRANLNSIRDGMSTKEELFPSHAPAAPSMESENIAQAANAAAAGAPDPKAKPAEPEKPKEAEKKPEPEKQPTEQAKQPEAEKPKADDKPKRSSKKKDAEPKPEPAKAEDPAPAKAQPLVNDEGVAEGKDIYDELTNGLEAALEKCEEDGNNDALMDFNGAIMDKRKLLKDPYASRFRALMKEAWTRDFGK